MNGLALTMNMIFRRAIASLADDAQFSKSETAWLLMPFAGWIALIIVGAPQ
jgi:hypothetical protein